MLNNGKYWENNITQLYTLKESTTTKAIMTFTRELSEIEIEKRHPMENK
jgi:hypothetical protein